MLKLFWPLKNVNLMKPIVPFPGQVYISQHFGENPQIYAQFGLKGHDGLDMAAPLGTPVYAAHDGFIIESLTKATDYGLRVVIYNPEGQFTTIYGHFEKSAFDEKAFDWNARDIPVKAGDIIGYVDSTGFSTGNHLHLGLRFYNNYQVLNYGNGFFGYVDPLPYLLGEGMSNAVFVHKAGTGEYGFYIPSLSEDGLRDKALNLGQSILKPDGTIDYTQAKEMTLPQ